MSFCKLAVFKDQQDAANAEFALQQQGWTIVLSAKFDQETFDDHLSSLHGGARYYAGHWVLVAQR